MTIDVHRGCLLWILLCEGISPYIAAYNLQYKNAQCQFVEKHAEIRTPCPMPGHGHAHAHAMPMGMAMPWPMP